MLTGPRLDLFMASLSGETRVLGAKPGLDPGPQGSSGVRQEQPRLLHPQPSLSQVSGTSGCPALTLLGTDCCTQPWPAWGHSALTTAWAHRHGRCTQGRTVQLCDFSADRAQEQQQSDDLHQAQASDTMSWFPTSTHTRNKTGCKSSHHSVCQWTARQNFTTNNLEGIPLKSLFS